MPRPKATSKNSCYSQAGGRKHSYPSLERARAAAEILRRERNRVLYPYKCSRCRLYHLSATLGADSVW